MFPVSYRGVNGGIALTLGLVIVCGEFSPVINFLIASFAANFAINAALGPDEKWLRQFPPGGRDVHEG